MSDHIPLGEREGLRLEFKGAASLRAPDNIGRVVVGLLNAQGGTIWIGLQEAEGVAVKIEGIDDPERAERALFDHLVETIEPPPRDEIKIEQVRDPDSHRVLLCVRVKAGTRDVPPYSYRHRDGRYFGIRVGDRLRVMTWHEIFRSTAPDLSESKWKKAAEGVEEQLKRAIALSQPVLWLCLKPVGRINLDLGRHLEDHFIDPATTNNRPNGWTFVDRGESLKVRSDRIVHGKPEYRHTQVHRSGLITFTAPLSFLYWKGEPGLLWPYALIEFPVSIFRLAAHLYGPAAPDDDRIAVQMALLSANGCKLKGGSVKSVRWQFQDARVFEERDIISQLVEQRWSDVSENPDRCAYPLIKGVYEAFGFEEEDIPHEFDPVTGLQFAA